MSRFPMIYVIATTTMSESTPVRLPWDSYPTDALSYSTYPDDCEDYRHRLEEDSRRLFSACDALVERFYGNACRS
jgi:hypothetical protein